MANTLVEVKAVEDAYGNCEAASVEEEKKTPWVKMLELVAAVVVPNELKPHEKSCAPELTPQAAALAVSVPSAATCTQRVPTPPALERMKFVVEAVVAEIAVVEAYGKVDAIVEVAKKLLAETVPCAIRLLLK